ncbi:MAG: GNAT family N-acetyltransferase [Spirochaetales bacterium]|nr:GNAT family N-acetyltransferase [Spirochaetales bacterium]
MIATENHEFIIREHQISDLEIYHSWRSDYEILKYSRLPQSHSEEESFIFLANDIGQQKNPQRREYFLALLLKSTNSYIGSIAYIIEKREHHGGVVEIGYFLMKDYWQKGYGSRATMLLIDHIFKTHPVHKIVANCDSRNRASEGVMIKCGMKKEGHFSQDRFYDNQWFDNLHYALLKDDWEKSQTKPNS